MLPLFVGRWGSLKHARLSFEELKGRTQPPAAAALRPIAVLGPRAARGDEHQR